MNTHAKHLFFDMDNTVTPSRSLIEDEYHAFLSSLSYDIIVVSGAHSEQIRTQLRDLPIYRLGQNGNEARDPEHSLLWIEELTDAHTRTITEHIEALKRCCSLDIHNEDDLVEHRGAQISYSIIGHNADHERKKLCDPDQSIRQSLLAQVPFDCDDLEVKIGGSTCFDYIMKGKTKGHNVARLIEYKGWNSDDCVYFGDALFPGGNDETVIGVIQTIPVRDHHHTYQLLREYYN